MNAESFPELILVLPQNQMSAPSTTLVPAAGTIAPVAAGEIHLPHDKTLKHAARIAIEHDKPICLDYFNDTLEQKAFLGEDEKTKDKMLVRSAEEYTSLIQRIFKVADDFIVITENSIYIIHGSTKKKTISSPQ
jgi:hypothetical protein